jgi:hypothetical protein
MRRRLAVLGVVGGMLASGALTLSASYAAFNSTTTNGPNNWAAGSVTLTDDDSGAAMFTTGSPGVTQVGTGAMKPGQSVVNCIKVTFAGNLANTVKFYAWPVSGANGPGGTGILSYLHVKIEQATAGDGMGPACTNFGGTVTTIWDSGTHPNAATDSLADFPTTRALGPSVGPASWNTNDFRVYRFTVSLDDTPTLPNTSQGATATATFTWDAQNT